MKIPLRIGIPALLVMLAGTGLTEGPERTAFIVGAMGMAIWSAFSIPHPGPREPEPGPLMEGEEEEANGDDQGR